MLKDRVMQWIEQDAARCEIILLLGKGRVFFFLIVLFDKATNLNLL